MNLVSALIALGFSPRIDKFTDQDVDHFVRIGQFQIV